jgi:hypothetical protein
MDHFEKFKQKANLKYQDKYDYARFQYVNAKTASVIICPEHGEFSQKPDHHIRPDAIGCPQCVPLLKRRDLNRVYSGPETLSQEDYLQRVNDRYAAKFSYDMSNYQGLTKGTVTITCPHHGESTYVRVQVLWSAGSNSLKDEIVRRFSSRGYF